MDDNSDDVYRNAVQIIEFIVKNGNEPINFEKLEECVGGMSQYSLELLDILSRKNILKIEGGTINVGLSGIPLSYFYQRKTKK